MKMSKYGFFVPDYIDEADIPVLITANVEVFEKIYAKMLLDFEEKQIEQDKRIYASLGVVLYDGGTFNSAANGAELDGGSFTDTSDTTIDCGTFEPLFAALCREYCQCSGGETTKIIDGGGFDNLTGEIIDGGGYDNTDGEIIDCGKFSTI